MTTSDCIAVGGLADNTTSVVLITQDAGTTWTITDTLTSTSLWSAYCISTSECFVVGNATSGGKILSSSDGGMTWSSETVPLGFGAYDLTCISASDCIAVGSWYGADGVLTTTNDGGTWTTSSVPTGEGQLYGVACTSSTNCYAAGQGGTILATTDGGSTWTNQSISPSINLWSIACTPTQCFAAGEAGSSTVVMATSGGGTWADSTIPPNESSRDVVACASALNCFVSAGDVILDTTDGGSTWTPAHLPFGLNTLTSITCPTVSDCFAAGGIFNSLDVNGGATILASTDGGATWESQTIPAGFGTIYGIACASPSNCVAVGYNFDYSSFILTTSDGGATWTSESIPSGIGYLTGVACATGTSDCYAVGESTVVDYVDGVVLGAVISTTDGGATWVSDAVPIGVASLQSIACPAVSNCYAVSARQGRVIATSDGGATWTLQSAPDLPKIIGVPTSSIACPSTTDCYVENGAVMDATTDGGLSWTQQAVPTDVGSLDGIACSTDTQCVAVGGTTIGTTDGGLSWVDETGPSSVNITAAVCPPTATGCLAVGNATNTDSPLAGGAVILAGNIWDLSVATPSLPGGTSGSSYSASLDATGGASPYSWSIASGSLPAGLTLDASTGDITGTPTSTGESSFTVEAADSSSPTESATANLSITIAPPLDITTTALPGGATGKPYSASLTHTGGTAPYTWSINSGSLPAGLSLDPSTGAITGTPTSDSSSQSSLTVMVTDSSSPAATATASLSITVIAPLTITTTALPPGVAGHQYMAALFAAGGTAPYTWSGAVPQGLTLSGAGGFIVGVPASPGATMVNLEVTDANNLNAFVSLPITVLAHPGVYVPLGPVRVCDTRPANPSHLTGAAAQCSNGEGGETLAANGTVSFSLAGNFGVPASGVTAVMLNVTAVGAKSAGYLTVFPSGQSTPTASNLNYVPGQAVPNLVEVGIGAGGEVSIFSPSPTGAVVDLEGYVTSNAQSGAGLYNALSTPARICDTRGGNPSGLNGGDTQCNTNLSSGSKDHLVGPTNPLSIKVAGNGGVPSSGVSAVVLNVTVTSPAAGGYVTAYPTGQPRPVASNANFVASQTVANRVTVPVGTDGQVTLYSASASDLVVDVSGWYTAKGGNTGSEFTPEIAPVRICDTRGSNPSDLVAPNTQCNTDVTPGGPADPLVAGNARTLRLTGLAEVPTGASAAALNVTDISPTGASYLTVYPQGNPPTTSDVDPSVGGVQANFTVAGLTAPGAFDVIDQGSGSAQLVVDVSGWYMSTDSSAQINLNRAMTNAKLTFQMNGGWFESTEWLVAALTYNENLLAQPNLYFITIASTQDDQVSVATSSDGTSVILAAESPDSDSCWYIVYNSSEETASYPWSSPGAVYVGAGTWYGEVKGTGTPPVCNASTVPGGANTPTQAFQSGGFPRL